MRAQRQSVVNDLFILTRQAGFTLVEMLVALVLISVGLLAMASMSLTVLRTNYQNDLRNGAARVASDLAEDLYAMPFDSVVTSPTPVTRTLKLRGTMNYTLSWEVADQTNNLKEVKITVLYADPGLGTNRTNTTVIYRHRAI